MKKLVLFTALLCLSLSALAQDYSIEENKETTKQIPMKVDNIRLIYSLSHYGYKNENAISLITAAQILKQKKYKLPDVNADKLLEDAKQFANGDRTVLAMIKKIKKDAKPKKTDPINDIIINHGAVGEEKYSLDMIKAYATDTYKINFKENQKAVVQIKGVGLTDLDLYIYDSNGNLITSDTAESDDCECTWIPVWTGEFTIRIKNSGGMYNLYFMQTN